MWGKKAFLSAAIVLTLISAANAELVLTLNGVDAAKEPVNTAGKNNLVIAVVSDANTDANSYSIKVNGGAINSTASGGYSFAFEGDMGIGDVSIVANNDMVIDGTSVKGGDTIHELILCYDPETDTVVAVGLNLEVLSEMPPEQEPTPAPEPQIELNLQAEPELRTQPQAEAEVQQVLEIKPESKAEIRHKPLPMTEMGTKTSLPLSKQKPQKISRMKHLPEVSGSLSLEDWKEKKEEALAAAQYSFDSSMESSGGFDGFPTSSCTTGLRRAGTTGGFEMLTMDDENYTEVEAGAVITENTIWDYNYLLLGGVEVNNATLIIKPGVKIRIVDGKDGIIVRNNGCIIANGTPDSNICFFPTVAFPYAAYGCAIWLDETASPLCEISYCTVFCAFTGILNLNHRLETPFHDNSFWDCTVGINQYGPKLTDVINNEIYNPEDPEEVLVLPIGIAASLADVCGVAENSAEIYIGNNTISGDQTYGIYVSGVADANDTGTVVIANNLMAGCRDYGIKLVNGWMKLLVINNGYYLNYHNINVPEAQESTGQLEEGPADSNMVAPIEDFNSYTSPDALKQIWKGYNEELNPLNCAVVYVTRGVDYQNLVRDGNSMEYEYYNYNAPYYA
jgi:hypothetical protein